MRTIKVLNRGIEFVPEEPGYIAVVILVLAFLALTPKAGCSFQADGTPAPDSAPAAHAEAH